MESLITKGKGDFQDVQGKEQGKAREKEAGLGIPTESLVQILLTVLIQEGSLLECRMVCLKWFESQITHKF